MVCEKGISLLGIDFGVHIALLSFRTTCYVITESGICIRLGQGHGSDSLIYMGVFSYNSWYTLLQQNLLFAVEFFYLVYGFILYMICDIW